MNSGNIAYKSKEIQAYYSCYRSRWQDFYPSERWAFTKIAGKKRLLGDVLDVGCACGGLGAALCERFQLKSYTGVDINNAAIAWTRAERRLPVPATFIAGDIVEAPLGTEYDTVVSLSCADWNIETGRIINTCWSRVKPGGSFVISVRLTPEQGINDLRRSFQYINFSGSGPNPEVANYVVFNFRELLGLLAELQPPPSVIGAYGYWGKPSVTAVTPFKKLVFAVFYLRKGPEGSRETAVKTELRLPLEVFL
jgi:SAM-dependent methyltransferase